MEVNSDTGPNPQLQQLTGVTWHSELDVHPRRSTPALPPLPSAPLEPPLLVPALLVPATFGNPAAPLGGAPALLDPPAPEPAAALPP